MRNSIYAVFIIALREEYKIFCEVIKNPRNDTINIQDDTIVGEECCRFHTLSKNGDKIGCIAFCMADMGNTLSKSITEKILKEISPNVIINIGIAGRYDDKLNLGDIIIGEKIDGFIEQTKIVGKSNRLQFEFSGKAHNTTYQLAKIIRTESKSIREMIQTTKPLVEYKEKHKIAISLKDRINHNKYEVSTRSIASGPFVSASTKMKSIVLAKDRKFACVEMEASGVAWACHEEYPAVDCIILKTISDFADENKSTLDDIEDGWIRSTVMENLSYFALHSIKILSDFVASTNKKQSTSLITSDDIPSQEDFEKININGKYLDRDLEKINISEFTDFFSIVTGHKRHGNDIFIKLAKSIIKDDSVLSAIVYGEKGTGKSSFMALLYNTLKQELANNELKPAYFNIARSLKNISQSAPREDDDILLKIVDQIESYLKKISPNVILLLDGFDDTFFNRGTIRNDLCKRLIEKIKSIEVSKAVVGASNYEILDKLSLCNFIDTDEPTNEIELRKIHSKSDNLRTFVEKYLQITFNEKVTTSADELINKIMEFKLFSVDIFILSVLHKNINKKRFQKHKTFSEFLESYCRFKLQKHHHDLDENELLDSASEEAFNLFIKKCQYCDTKYYLSLGKHESITNYLIAHYFVNCISKFKESDDVSLFKFVFNDELNNFIKEQVNSNREITEKVVESLIKIANKLKESSFDNHYLKGLTHICYIMGRIKRKALLQKSSNFLKKMKSYAFELSREDEAIKLNPDYGLLIRTIYISLGYLGFKKEINEYLDRLFNEPSEENLNRGFHMEYYGDIAFKPNISMNHRDNGQDCSKTISHIFHKIHHINDYKSNLIEVEIHTVLSLIQNRHSKNTLTISVEKARSTINKVLTNGIINHEKLKHFAEMVLKNLQFPSYTPFKLIDDLYMNKFLPRTGWINRSTGDHYRLESVAEHTFGTLLIANFFLKEGGDEKGKEYDKRKIIDILFVHDLAEAFTGDIINKTEEQFQNERSWMEYISQIGTYYQMPDTTNVLSLFNEYNNNLTIEGDIAKDIDKLETVLQAYIYKRAGVINDEGLEEFFTTNLPRIKTDTVKSIRKKLIKFMEQNKANISDFEWPQKDVSLLPTY